MNLVSKNSIPFLQFSHLASFSGLTHAVTTRRGGVSEKHFSSLNLGVKTGDDPKRVSLNRKKAFSALGSKEDVSVISDQVHGNKVFLVGANFKPPTRLSGIDGFITREHDIMLMIKIADCIPVFFYDPETPAIGLIHAGWRGTVKGIIPEGIKLMKKSFGSKPEKIKAGIGPGISRCCFEVKADVREEFDKKNFGDSIWRADADKRLFLDLKKAILLELINCGLQTKNIETAKECTACDSELFFSHRRDKGKTGRMAALLGLKRY